MSVTISGKAFPLYDAEKHRGQVLVACPLCKMLRRAQRMKNHICPDVYVSQREASAEAKRASKRRRRGY